MKPGNLEMFGFHKIVRDFDRAVALAGFSGTQAFLLQLAREASWSEASLKGEEAKPFKFSPSELAKIKKCSPARICEGQAQLIQMGILRKSENGDLAINKDYRTWLSISGSDAGKPMFDADQLAYIMQPKTRKRAASVTENRNDDVTEKRNDVTENRNQTNTSNYGKPEDSLRKSVMSVTENRNGPYIGTHASERFRDLEIKHNTACVRGEVSQEQAKTPEPAPAYESKTLSPEAVSACNRVMKLIVDKFGDHEAVNAEACGQVAMRHVEAGHDPAVVFLAFGKAIDKGCSVPSIPGFVHSVLSRTSKQVSPTPPPAAKPAALPEAYTVFQLDDAGRARQAQRYARHAERANREAAERAERLKLRSRVS